MIAGNSHVNTTGYIFVNIMSHYIVSGFNRGGPIPLIIIDICFQYFFFQSLASHFKNI